MRECILTFSVAGVSYYQENLLKCSQEIKPHCADFIDVKLEYDPDNKYSNEAIKVLIGDESKLYHVGYIPEKLLGLVNQFDLHNLIPKFVEYNYNKETLDIVGVYIRIYKR